VAHSVRSALFEHLVVATLLLTAGFIARGAGGQAKPGEPTDPKARKTFAEAVDWEKHGAKDSAIDCYRKAYKQDGGHCSTCLERAYKLALEIGDYKSAEGVAHDWLSAAQTDADRASDHFSLAVALQREGIADKEAKCVSDSCDEF